MTCWMSTKILKTRIQIKKSKVLIVFDHMIADMINNKKLSPVVTELFIRGRKLKTLLSLFHNLILECQKI